MKKILLLLTVFSMVFTSCDPLEDIYSELDTRKVDGILGDITYTLTEENYKDLGLTFGNFSSEADAKTKLPAFISEEYPALGVTWKADGTIEKASSATITYKLFNKKNDEKSLKRYTVTSADYTAGGHSFGNFSSFSDITTFLDTKYPTPANRLLVSLTYKYYNGSVSTLNNGFINVNGTWEMHTGISDDEYTAMGEGRAQFSNEDEALAKIPLFLKSKASALVPKKGDIEGVMYKLYVTDTQDIDNDGSIKDSTVYSFVVFFIYDGANWSKYDNNINVSIQFAHDGTTWVPDNTIKYTLTPADFALVGNGSFNNFDVRTGKDEETVEARRVKINTILLNNFPQYGQGQKFSVSYAVWKPGDDIFVMNVVHDGTEYVLQ